MKTRVLAGIVLAHLATVAQTPGEQSQCEELNQTALASAAETWTAPVPLDRIKLLNARAVAHAKRGEWQEAQEKWCEAIAIADRAGVSNPVVLTSVLNNYAVALRKNHHRRAARAMEARAAMLPRNPAAGAVVDVSELLAESEAHKH